MQPTDWIDGIAHLGPWIVALAAIVMWGFKGNAWRSHHDEDRRQTELLARIAAKLDAKQS